MGLLAAFCSIKRINIAVRGFIMWLLVLVPFSRLLKYSSPNQSHASRMSAFFDFLAAVCKFGCFERGLQRFQSCFSPFFLILPPPGTPVPGFACA
jgi:hypothetical protein